MNIITVEIDPNDYPEHWDLTEAAYESWIIGKLLDAGIPIKGRLCFHGVKQGSLESRKSFDTDTITYIWRPHDNE